MTFGHVCDPEGLFSISYDERATDEPAEISYHSHNDDCVEFR